MSKKVMVIQRFLLLVAALLAYSESIAATVSFGEGDAAFEIELIAIGDAGNPPDTRTQWTIGAVSYDFDIAKHEASCRVGLAPSLAGVFDDFDSGCPQGSELPLSLTWPEAAQFVNWLNTSSGFEPAYKLGPRIEFSSRALELWSPLNDGYDPRNPTRNALARYALPTADEWHKAAYYDPSAGVYRLYATGDTPPTNLGPEGGTEPNTALYDASFRIDVTRAGGLSAYGTMGQTGNMSEWEEGRFNLQDADLLGVRGDREGAEAAFTRQTAITARSLSKSGLSGIRVVSITPPQTLDCNSDGLVDAVDLGCANEARTTPHLLANLDLVYGDLNADQNVDLSDFLILADNFGLANSSYPDGDIDGDGTVRFDDFVIMATTFGTTENAVTVPEPSTFVPFVIVFGAVGLLRRSPTRRRIRELGEQEFRLFLSEFELHHCSATREQGDC